MKTAFAISLFFAVHCSASLTTAITVGETEIIVPIPAGFAEITSEMKPYADYAKAYVPSTNKQFLLLHTSEDVALAASGSMPQSNRKLYVQSTTQLIPISATHANFSEVKKVIRDQNVEMVKKAQAQMPSELEKISRDSSKIQNIQTEIAVNEMTPLPAHYESERAIAYSMIVGVNASVKDGETSTSKAAVTLTYVLVKSKIIMLYCVGSETEAEWTRNQSQNWVEALVAANPSSDAIRARENATKRSGFDWRRVGYMGLIGAVVGGAIGLFGHLSKKRRAS